jgi:hypothetical protein
VNDLIQLVDGLEDRAAGYLTLDDVERALGGSACEAVEQGVLLVDYRERIDSRTGARQPVTLCRLNRQHPLVRQLTAW